MVIDTSVIGNPFKEVSFEHVLMEVKSDLLWIVHHYDKTHFDVTGEFFYQFGRGYHEDLVSLTQAWADTVFSPKKQRVIFPEEIFDGKPYVFRNLSEEERMEIWGPVVSTFNPLEVMKSGLSRGIYLAATVDDYLLRRARNTHFVSNIKEYLYGKGLEIKSLGINEGGPLQIVFDF